MASRKRTCKGCGTVAPSPRCLEGGYCEPCCHDLEHLTRAELRVQRPRLWEQLLLAAKREVGDTGGYVRADGVVVTLAEVRATAKSEERGRLAAIIEGFWQMCDDDDESLAKSICKSIADGIRALPASEGSVG